jgi:hypothetical protein
VRKPFLETRIEDLEKGWGVTVYEPGMPKNWQ